MPGLSQIRLISKALTAKTLLFAAFLLAVLQLEGQSGSFLQNLRVGAGAGMNFTSVITSSGNNIYEDLSGNIIETDYSTMIENLSGHYYFHAEYPVSQFIVGLRPGTYSYRFERKNTLIFEQNENEQVNDFTLRYFEIPLDIKYRLLPNRIQPFLGGTISWGTLLGGGEGGGAFIRNRLSMGINGGGYFETGVTTVMIAAGYNLGPHNITRKQERFETAIENPYSLDDLKLNNLNINLSVLFSLEKQRFSATRKCRYPYR
jgi:hypothetical protein